MNTNQNKSFLQGQPGVSYYIQPTTPTDTQTLIVSQPASHSAPPVQPSPPPHPPQSDSDHVTLPTPKNGHHGRRHSSHREKLPYSYRYIPEEVSDYISQDQSGEIHLSADLNKMFGLGRCISILALLEIFGYGFQAAMNFLAGDILVAVIYLVCIVFPILFINGYIKMSIPMIVTFYIWRVITIVGSIIWLFLAFAIYFSSKNKVSMYIFIYGAQFILYV